MSPPRSTAPTAVAERFVEALRTLERDGDPTALADLYAEESVTGNVHRPDGHRGRDGARQFWLAYRALFGEVRSTFRTVVATKEAAALEWTTEGTVGGTPVRYDGVTVLQLVKGQIARSCAYFDPTKLGRETLRARTAGPGGVDSRTFDEPDGWRADPEEIG